MDKNNQGDMTAVDPDDTQAEWCDVENPILKEVEESNQKRRDYASKLVDEDIREKFNNFNWLSVSLWSVTEEMDKLIEAVSASLPTKLNKKRRLHLRITLANLLKTWSKDETKYIAFHRKHNRYSNLKARYNPAGVTKLVVKVVDELLEAGYIEHHKGRFSVAHAMGYCSKMRATAELVKLMEASGFIPEEMIEQYPGAELIRMRAARGSKWGDGKVKKTGGGWIDYEDTPATKLMREEAMFYNAFLQEFDIRPPDRPEPKAKGVYRVFNNSSWSNGGRFTGGWWIDLNEELRESIQIDGKSTVELDYGSSMLSLLYATRGFEPEKDTDLYALNGFDRTAVKLASMRCINNKSRYHAINGIKAKLEEDYPDTAHLIDVEDLINQFEELHSAVSDDFYKGMGFELQYHESVICSNIIMKLMGEDICCLPIYDSFIVQEEHKDKLKAIMISAFKDVMDVDYDPVIK